MRPGVRVVRGPDWNGRKQDNGEGFLGTVIFVPKQGSNDNKVTVIWDSGRELRYRAGQDGKYDLRVFDTAPIGNFILQMFQRIFLTVLHVNMYMSVPDHVF